MDDERAILAVELVKAGIRKELNNDDPEKYAVFIRTAVINHWIGKQLRIDLQDVRNMVNTGKITCFDPSIKRYPLSSSNDLRASGILFVGDRILTFSTIKVPILTMSSENSVKIIGYCEDGILTEAIRKRQAERDSAEALRLATPPEKPGLAAIAATPAQAADPDLYDDYYDPAEDI